MTTEEIKVKIGCFIDAALKEEIPWSTLEKFLNKMTQSLEKSREVIKVLLRIIRVMQQPITTESEIKSEKIQNFDESEVIEIDEEDEPDEMILEDIKISGMKCRICDKTFITAKALERHSKRHEKQPDAEKTAMEVDINEDLTAKKIDVMTEHFTNDENIETPVESDLDINDKENETSVEHSFDVSAGSSIRNGDVTEGVVEYNSTCEVFETVVENKDSNESFDDEGNINMIERKISFECETCGKYFKKKNYLIRHTMIHTGENPFKCSKCEKGFAHAKLLERHDMIHTGKKPFKCKTCNKCFVQSSDLTNHERVHTGEKHAQNVLQS